MLETLQAQITTALAVAVFALAIWQGERPERLAGIVYAITWVLSTAAHVDSGPQYGIFAVDVLFLAFNLWLGLRTGRMWALFAAAFQLLIVMTHVSMIVDLRIEQYGFLSAYLVWSYLITLALLVGTLQVIARRRRT